MTRTKKMLVMLIMVMILLTKLVLHCGRRYLTQIVVREEEEATPNGAGGAGDLYFFPLPEVTFVAKQDTDDSVSTHPVSSAALRTALRKRFVVRCWWAVACLLDQMIDIQFITPTLVLYTLTLHPSPPPPSFPGQSTQV